MSESESTSAWVTVAEAAEQANVDSGTVRQWYRAGRIPTRRADGGSRAFLVPLDLVLGLARPMDAGEAPAPATLSIEEALRGLAGNGWSAEAESLKVELAAVNEQVEVLRAQLTEAGAENRSLREQLAAADDQRADLRAQLADVVDDRKGISARLATVEAELTQLRRTAARSSITDNSWLELQTPAYESPVRRQAMSTPPPPAGGPTAPYGTPAPSASGGELADLLAATRPDGADDAEDRRRPTWTAEQPDDRDRATDPVADDRAVAPRAIWTDEAPHPPLGESPDDLLPGHERRSRFGKR
jgi:hypothetical protein